MTGATRRENDLWLLENLVPGTPVNNLSVVFEVEGRISEQALRRALQAVVRRHGALRTVFLAGDAGLERREEHDLAVPFEVLPCEEAAASEEELRGYIARPFALDGGPLLRAAVFRGTGADTVCLAAHHLVFDAMSGGIVLEELVAAYEAEVGTAGASADPGGEVRLPEADPSAASLEFWKRHLDGYRADGLGMRCDRQGEPPVTLAGGVFHHELSAEADAGVARLRRELRAPKAVALLVGYYVTLALHGVSPDLVVGVPASMRSTDAQRAVGYHVNMLPLRADLGPQRPVREVAAEVRTAFFEALAHPDVPAETFLPQDRGDRPAWRNTLFRHVFNYVPTDFRTAFTLDGASAVQRLVENGTSKYDLEFFLSESAETALLSVVYNSQVLGREDIAALVARYDGLLAELPGLLDTPVGGLDRWSERDRGILPATAHAPGAGPAPSAEVVEAVRRAAEQDPARPAVRTPEGELSYADLWTAVRDGGTGPAAEAAAALRTLSEPDGGPGAHALRRVADTAGDLARAIGAGTGAEVAWAGGTGTPAAATELFLALACRGTAVAPGASGDAAPGIVHGTPARMRELLDAGAPFAGVTAVVAGEPLPPALAGELLRRGAEVHAAHRPANPEDGPHCVAVRRVEAAPDAAVPGGAPLAGAAPFVADADGRRLPPGQRGRLGFAADGADVLTGETAVWRADGTLDVLGGTPEETARLALLAHPAVVSAAVVAAGSGDDRSLFAFVTADEGADLGTGVRDRLVAVLPRSAVPDRIVRVEALPVSDGVTDLDRLAAEAAKTAEATAAVGAEGGPAPGTPAEDGALTGSLVRLWGEFLDRADLDADANFFSEGGHSLLGAQLVQRVKKRTGAALRLSDLFAAPTPKGFAELLSGPEHGVADPVA